MSSSYQKLLNNLEALNLGFMREYVPNYIDIVNEQEIPFTEALLKLTEQELVFQEEQKVERVIKRNVRYDVLIIDEIGYLPIQKVEADLFFQLLTLRYEQKTTMVTSNITLSRWGELFQNTEIAAAILDRLVHHAKIFKITGKSYRLKGKLKSD